MKKLSCLILVLSFCNYSQGQTFFQTKIECFASGFEDLPFRVNTKFLAQHKVHTMALSEYSLQQAGTPIYVGKKIYNFDTLGNLIYFCWHDRNNKDTIHHRILTYKNGNLYSDITYNHFWNPWHVSPEFYLQDEKDTLNIQIGDYENYSFFIQNQNTKKYITFQKTYNRIIRDEYIHYWEGDSFIVRHISENDDVMYIKNAIYDNKNNLVRMESNSSRYHDYYTFNYDSLGQLMEENFYEIKNVNNKNANTPIKKETYLYNKKRLLIAVNMKSHVAAMGAEKNIKVSYTFY